MILVTGGSGLVGTHLIKLLVSQRKAVRALYRSAIPLIEEAKEVEWVKGDLLDTSSLEIALQGVHQVYHCAAMVSFHPKNKAQLQRTNVTGTANMVNACVEAGVEKLLFISSVAALGRIREDQPINESMNWTSDTSNSEYGKSKYLAEMEVWRGIGEGLNAVIVNPVIILGAGNWNQGSTAIFKSAWNEFPWYTEGTSGFIAATDLVRAMILLMESEVSAERFILSGGDHSYREVFTQIARAFHKKPPYRKVTPFLSAIVWRVEAIKAMITGKHPLLTRETARTAQAKVKFDTSKFTTRFPDFNFTPLSQAIEQSCREIQKNQP